MSEEDINDYAFKKAEEELAKITGQNSDSENPSENAPPVNADEALKEYFRHDAEVDLSVSKDQMTATMSITPACNGKHAEYSEVTRMLVEHGIVTGIDFEIVKSLITESHNSDKEVSGEIAWGIPAVPGTDASYAELFHENRPVLTEKDQIDHRERNIFDTVAKDDKLLVKTPAVPGKDGMTVTGTIIKAPPVNDYTISAGENVRFDSKTLSYFADTDGKVDLTASSISVQPFFFVNGDVNMSVGNIRFNGDIEINGSVLDDFSVCSTKNIIIHGQVYAAEIKSTGSITVMKGFMGRNKGILDAGRNVSVEFVENGTIQAGGNVTITKAAIHSEIKAAGSIFVNGNPGSIIGGSIIAQRSIEAVNIGNNMEVKTDIAAGRNFMLAEDYDRMLAERKQYESGIHQIQPIIERMVKGNLKLQNMTEKEKQVLATLVQKLKFYKANLSELNASIEKIKEQLTSKEKHTIKITGKLFPAVHITIGNTTTTSSGTLMQCVLSEDTEKSDIKIYSL